MHVYTIRDVLSNHVVLLLASCFLINGIVIAKPIKKEGEDYFDRSNIFVMYNENNCKSLKKYKVDNISWGSQVNVSRGAVDHAKSVLHSNKECGVKINSIDIALIQEGGKYVVCGNKWDFKCDNLFWGLRKKNKEAAAQLLSALANINNRAVLDARGKIVGVPWLVKRGMTIPMASVNDPGYKKWLIKKIDGVLEIKPDALHFDEPAMELVATNTRRPFGLTTHSLREFTHYLENTKEPGWRPDNTQQLDKFDYKRMVRANRSKSKNVIPPLWKEFTEFKVSSTVKIFGELVAYAKEQADWPLLISANASPGDWRTIPLVQYLDFIAPEINHDATKLEVPSYPLYIYKMAEALHKPIVSTAFGTDWAVIKNGKHVMLACAWIAQAYAAGQYMNFPLKAWIPGSSYQPRSDIYPLLAGWIKEKRDLFDGYETIASHALIINTDALRSHRNSKLFIGFTKKLMEKGVLFKIILEREEQKIKSPFDSLQDYESLIVALPEEFSEGTLTKLQAGHVKSAIWEVSKAEMPMALPRPELIQVEILDETGIFCLPRKKHLASQDVVVLHLLNRDYLPDSKRMKSKGPFRVRVSKKIFNHSKIDSAILHQPMLNEEFSGASVDLSSKLTVKDDGEYLTITVPSLGLWGIVEFISS